MSRVYVAYRKTGAHPDVQRVIDGMAHAHGPAALVTGVQVAAGSDAYRTMVENAIRECAGVVVVIGPEFVTEPDALGRRRLDDPGDPLRVEVEAGLKVKGMMLVVAMVGGLQTLDPKQLPRSLRPLSRRGAIPMGAVESFSADQSYLNTAVRRMLDGSARRLQRRVVAFFLLVTLVSLAVMIYAAVSANVP